MKKILFFLVFFLVFTSINVKGEQMILKIKHGDIHIELFTKIAPNHVKRFKELADSEQYDGVAFHRVIDGFMAQSGDVQFGNTKNEKYNPSLIGTGGSSLPDLKAEFSDLPHERGTLSMARSSDPNSANSQFFICLEAAPHLDRNYSIFGKVVKGMEYIDLIKKGTDSSGTVIDPDIIISLRSLK